MSAPASYLDGRVSVHGGDCLEVLRGLADASIDAVVTDPPYALVSIGKRFGKAGAKHSVNGKRDPANTTGAYQRASAGFMGKVWDTGERAFAVEFWAEVLRVLKPGGHVAAFAGTRTYHRLACAIEDAGFEIRDQLAWAYASGFPKSHDVSKAIDKAKGMKGKRGGPRTPAHAVMLQKGVARRGEKHAGWDRPWMDDVEAVADAQCTYLPASPEAAAWQGWGTALKPSWEPICLARKPLIGTVAENVLAHGTGAINVDGCRIGFATEADKAAAAAAAAAQRAGRDQNDGRTAYGRLENGEASIAPYLDKLEQGRWPANLLHDGSDEVGTAFPADAARFFFSAKADADDRIGSKHPTVKPVDLMQWLCRLITPPNGKILDPFAGTGTTGEAAWREGFSAVLVEREDEYLADIARRMALADKGSIARKTAIATARPRKGEALPLFGG